MLLFGRLSVPESVSTARVIVLSVFSFHQLDHTMMGLALLMVSRFVDIFLAGVSSPNLMYSCYDTKCPCTW